MVGTMTDFRRDKRISVQRKISGLGRTIAGGIRLASFGLFVLIFSQIEIEQDPVGTETFQRVADQGRGCRDRRGAAGTRSATLGQGPGSASGTHIIVSLSSSTGLKPPTVGRR